MESCSFLSNEQHIQPRQSDESYSASPQTLANWRYELRTPTGRVSRSGEHVSKADTSALIELLSRCSRAQFLFSIMVSGFDNVHIRANVPRLEQAIKYGQSAGDRIYTSFSTAHLIVTRLYIGDHRKWLCFGFNVSWVLTLW